jgi:DNA invertase Pin-like site-specific DNA recombinase
MLTVLGGLAEFEHELIRARTGEGRARALARGVKMGRPSKLTSSDPICAHAAPYARGRRILRLACGAWRDADHGDRERACHVAG